MIKDNARPRLDLCRKCVRFSVNIDDCNKDSDGPPQAYTLCCKTGRRHWENDDISDKEVIAWEWRNPHHFDFNDKFTFPHDCNYKLEHLFLKGQRRENGNTYEDQKN